MRALANDVSSLLFDKHADASALGDVIKLVNMLN